MGTNFILLLDDTFLYSHETEFIESLLSAGKKQLSSQFNFFSIKIRDITIKIRDISILEIEMSLFLNRDISI